MSEATDFLVSVAQAVSALTLYQEGHPARERAVESAYESLLRLQEVRDEIRFTFLGHEIVFNDRPLRSLKSWDWGGRLAKVGIQRLEVLGPVGKGEVELFLEDAQGRLAGTPRDTAEARQMRETNLRYGAVALRSEEEDGAGQVLRTATLGFDLRDEVETAKWLHEEMKSRKELHLLEAEALVRSLSVAMHGDQAYLIPLLRLKRFDQYTTTHALNVSVLAMALAEYIGLTPREVRTFGIAGLLHDLGKVAVPDEILNKPGKLTESEREVMNNHTVEGARIIMETEEHLDLAAVVAYEHHIKLNGGGYPTLTYHRACHQASDMVHVCDVFDALRTDRPYRDAWAQDRVLDYIEEGAGSEFDPDLAHAFVRMMRSWSDRVATVEDPAVELVGSRDEESPASPPTGASGASGADGAEGDDLETWDIGADGDDDLDDLEVWDIGE